MPPDREERCWKVIHSRDNVETVYLVTAFDKRMAIDIVKTETAEENVCCRHHLDCGWSAELFKPEAPYFLYSIDKSNGAMDTDNAIRAPLSCIVCLGSAP